MNRKYFHILFLVLVIFFGCGKEEEIRKAEMVPGYWQALKMTKTFINGVFSSEVKQGFFVEFYENNCGQLFDTEENPTEEIKWVFQERDTFDILLISTALNSSGGGLELYINEISEVQVIEEMNMRTFLRSEKVINGDMYTQGFTTFFVKQ